MTIAGALGLFAAGFGAGLAGSVAGLASLFSYPALLAWGLPPVTANVTNTVALVFSSAGSVLGSRPELQGQGRRVLRLAVAGMAGGAIGGALLLATPSGSFELIVPWLIAGASVSILVRRRLLVAAVSDGSHTSHRAGPTLMVAVGTVAVYGGYFGAGAGVMLLALLLFATGEPLPSANAVKNAVLGCANAVAAMAFVVFGDVRWAVVAPLGLGLLLGARLGPIIVRRTPATPLRFAIAAAGLVLAAKLAVDAYG